MNNFDGCPSGPKLYGVDGQPPESEFRGGVPLELTDDDVCPFCLSGPIDYNFDEEESRCDSCGSIF